MRAAWARSGYTYLVILLAIVLVLGAAWSFFIAARPEVGFFLEEGWKFRDAEPSDLYLGVTRFGSAVVGIALLVFAAIFAFGGPGDTASRAKDPDPVEASRTGSVPPVVVTAKPRDPEQVAKEKAKEQCGDLLPSIEEQAVWDGNGKLVNQDHISGIAIGNSADMTIASRPEGDIVTIRSGLDYVDKYVRPILSMTSSGATCVVDRSN